MDRDRPPLSHPTKILSLITLLGVGLTHPYWSAPAQATRVQTQAECNGETVFFPTHPDVNTLLKLYQAYLGTRPTELDLGMSRLDVAIAIIRLEEALKADNPNRSIKPLNPTDQASFSALKTAYAKEIAEVRAKIAETGDLRDADIFSSPQSRGFAAPGSGGIVSPTITQQPAPPPPSPVIAPPILTKASPNQRPLNESTSSIPEEPTERGNIVLPPDFNTEAYSRIQDNPFLRPNQAPLSTFSIDVDTASYSNVRRFIRDGQLPPKDAVRVEELINYFGYDYPNPDPNQPFSVSTEITNAPWNPQHQLVHVGLKGQSLSTQPPSNLVFLIDSSGSMQSVDKLGLVKRSLCLLVNQLRPEDRISIVTYAGNAGLVLPPTPGNQKQTILNAINQLEAGGSTAGGAGIELAYKQAEATFLPQGNNRVILATDGDFNIGQSSDAEMERLIESKRDKGIFLTVLGYGTGNYKDSKMETLADKGNGNYAYIDTIQEAQKVLVNDVRSTLFTIAKDVKIQVEFNPKLVQAYRLIGYENRILQAQDFNDDKKDAGEIGAGHTVTALYEIIPTGVTSNVKLPDIDALKYQSPTNPNATSNSNELMTVKLRYKHPQGVTSQLITRTVDNQVVPIEQASGNLRFAAAVAMYGMILRDSEYKGQASLDQVTQLSARALGTNGDNNYTRQEFLELVEATKPLLVQAQASQEQ
jgi:Ca-activated chloride channel family protein